VGLVEMRIHCHNGLTPETERYRFASYDDVSTRVEPSSRTSCLVFDKMDIRNSNHAATTCSLHNRRGACHVIAYFSHLTSLT
jgi:hypothetical protein